MIFRTQSPPPSEPPIIVTLSERTNSIVEVCLNGTVVAAFIGRRLRIAHNRVKHLELDLTYIDSVGQEITI